MPGLRITIPTTFDDTTLPILRADPILPASGALLLLEPGHPAAGTISLASGSPMPNIAAAQAATLLAVASDAVRSTLTWQGISEAGTTKGKVERSAKGGIHTILTASALATGDGLVIRPDQAIVDYLVAHPSNDLYVSLWARPTRHTGATMGYSATSFSTSESGSELLYALESNGATLPSVTNRLGGTSNPATPASGSPLFMNVAVGAYTGTIAKSGAAARDFTKLWGVGSHRPFFNLTAGNPSAILYRVYIEDLTVSGRSYATVSALDYQLYTDEVLASGGRYNGDTYTDPATIP